MAAIIITAIALFFTLPFIVKINFSFNSIKKSLFLKIYVYGIKVVTIRGVLADKILYSIGKTIKTFTVGKKRKKLKLIKPKKDIITVYINLSVAYGNQSDPVATTLVCATINQIIGFLDLTLKDLVKEDIRIIPFYNYDIICIHSEITIITNPLKIFSLFV